LELFLLRVVLHYGNGNAWVDCDRFSENLDFFYSLCFLSNGLYYEKSKKDFSANSRSEPTSYGKNALGALNQTKDLLLFKQ
jgi:hypothetical protein